MNESKVVQVAPDQENDMIQIMQCFGWSLASRQEMAVEGDTTVSSDGTAYTRVSRYVKLHLNRSLDLPNLNELRNLENEFHQISIPQKKGVGCAIALIAAALFGMYNSINSGDVSGALTIGGSMLCIGIVWLVINIKRNEEISKVIDASLQKRQKLLREAQTMLGR